MSGTPECECSAAGMRHVHEAVYLSGTRHCLPPTIRPRLPLSKNSHDQEEDDFPILFTIDL